jgi:cytochrome c551/c552
MKDAGIDHVHSSPIKTPKQLVTVVVLAFVVPVIVIIMLAQLVTSGKRLDAETLAPEAVAGRIQPLARVQFGDAAPAGGGAPKTGEEVYKAVCATCHANGIAGAHKFGDKAAWAPHIKEGLADLAKNAINGIRGMPARGGNPNLSDLEVTRAVVYLANAAGANFKEPEAPKAEAKPAPQAAAPAAPAAVAAAPAAAAAPVQTAQAAAPAAAGASGEQLLQKNGCVACHAVDKKLVGPSYKDVAAKYAGDGAALDKLAKKVKAGGAGVWGQVPMPPHPQLSDADLQAMVKYVLSVK